VCFTGFVARLKKLLRGGSDGNEQLTAIVGTLLLVVIAIEGATLLDLRPLLTVHAFVGVLLIPIVALKLASTGWRMLRYYVRGDDYVRRGPPHLVLRAFVAPLIVVSTVLLLATGVALLVLDQTKGTLVGLHKASFLVWLGAAALHVLPRIVNLPSRSCAPHSVSALSANWLLRRRPLTGSPSGRSIRQLPSEMSPSSGTRRTMEARV
jgi:hypothetical protein